MKILMFLATCLAAASLNAGTWYVDANASDDTGDGLTAATAKKYIQSAVALAEASDETPRVVSVAPGTYGTDADDKRKDSKNVYCRVLVTKTLSIVSSGSRDDTFIVGAADDGNDYGLGSGSIRGITFDDSGAAGSSVRGITFTNCTSGVNQQAAAGGAVSFTGSTLDVYVRDCTAVDCAAYYGGGFSGVTMLRSQVRRCHNDNNGNRGSALFSCRAYNCLFVENGSTSSYNEYILQGIGPYVNCTAVGNSGSLLRTGTAQLMYNSISILANRQEFASTNSGGARNLVTNGAGIDKQTESKSLTEDEQLAILVSPLTGDFRPLASGKAVGYGDPQYCSLEWIPEEDRNLDYFGNPRIVDDKVDAGAIQGAVTSSGGGKIIRPVSMPTTGGAAYTCKWYSNALSWPSQLRYAPPEGTFCTAVTNLAGSFRAYPRFTDSDGGFYQTYPPAGKTLKFTDIPATETLEVGSGKGYSTIQEAIDVASGALDEYTVIKVDPGTYDSGMTEMTMATTSMYNRVVIDNKNVFVVATGTAAETEIVGALDKSGAHSCGDAAVRCVAVNAGDEYYVGLRGFTLRGGATKLATVSAMDCASAAGGLYTTANSGNERRRVQLLDVTISGCHGYSSGSTCGGWLQNCTITDSESERYVARSSILSGCLLYESTMTYEHTLANGSQTYLSTVSSAKNGTRVAAFSASANSYASIFLDGIVDRGPTVKECIFWNVDIKETHPSSGYTVTDPMLAAQADNNYTPLIGSPAIGGADASEIPDFYIYAVGDYNHQPLNATGDGKVTVGAIQYAYTPRTIYVKTDGDDEADGLTRETAKASLSGAAIAAVCRGDVIRVAAGTYDQGCMEQTAAVVKTPYERVPSRAIIKPGVSLVSDEGAASTTIYGVVSQGDGGPWMRGLVLGDGASVKGFTFENCFAVSTKQTWSAANVYDEYLGAAILASTNVGCSVTVEDCVFTGSRASFGAVAFGRATFRRCKFQGNVNTGSSDTNGGVVYCGTFENCLFSGNSSKRICLGDCGGLAHCTFIENGIQPYVDSFGTFRDGASVVNTVIAMRSGTASTLPKARNTFIPTIGSLAHNWTITDDDGSNIVGVELSSGAAGLTDATVWADDANTRDRGSNGEMLASETTDLAGLQRIYNGTTEIGCYEHDVRGDFAGRLAPSGKVKVSEASSAATLSSGSRGVELTDGTSLKLVRAPSEASAVDCKIRWTLDGSGTLTIVDENGETVATATASGDFSRSLASGSYTFSFSGDGTLILDRPLVGVTLIIR